MHVELKLVLRIFWVASGKHRTDNRKEKKQQLFRTLLFGPRLHPLKYLDYSMNQALGNTPLNWRTGWSPFGRFVLPRLPCHVWNPREKGDPRETGSHALI